MTNSEGAEAAGAHHPDALVASNGFAGGYSRAAIRSPASVLAGEGTGMERDYEWSSAIHFDDLMRPAKVGRNAGAIAVARLNPSRRRRTRACR